MAYFWMGFYFILGTAAAILLLFFMGSFVAAFRKAFEEVFEKARNDKGR